MDMFFILMSEIFQGRKDRIGSSLSQSANCRILDGLTQHFQHVQIRIGSLPARNLGKYPQSLCQAFTARRTFSTRFRSIELQKVTSHINHTVILVHHHHTARTHDSTNLGQRFIINCSIK